MTAPSGFASTLRHIVEAGLITSPATGCLSNASEFAVGAFRDDQGICQTVNR